MKKTRGLKSWSKHNVPDDIWSNIFSRLPVKSLLRFRCVSMSWKRMIDDPDFARLHLIHFKNNSDETRLFVHDYDGPQPINNYHGPFRVRCSTTLRTTARLGCPESHDLGEHNRWDVLCSVDGLFMLKRSLPDSRWKYELWLWNPSTSKSRCLPPFPEDSSISEYAELGMGYAPLIEDYKHVRLAFRERTLCWIAVYTVGSRSWKTIDFPAKGHSYWYSFADRCRKSVYFRGCLYVIALKEDSHDRELVTFDLSTEAFAFASLPRNIGFAKLLVCRGCSLAAFVYAVLTTPASLWVLESFCTGDDNKSTCWTKLYTFPEIIPTIIHVKKNGEFLQTKKIDMGKQVISYNPETDVVKTLLKRIGILDMFEVRPYIESLIQP